MYDVCYCIRHSWSSFTQNEVISSSLCLSFREGFPPLTVVSRFVGQQSRRVQLRPASRDQSQQRRLRGGEPRRRRALLHAPLRAHLVEEVRKENWRESWIMRMARAEKMSWWLIGHVQTKCDCRNIHTIILQLKLSVDCGVWTAVVLSDSWFERARSCWSFLR